MTAIIAPGYADFLAQLKTQIRQRQYQALRAVNRELVGLYWGLGQAIHKKRLELGFAFIDSSKRKSGTRTMTQDLK